MRRRTRRPYSHEYGFQQNAGEVKTESIEAECAASSFSAQWDVECGLFVSLLGRSAGRPVLSRSWGVAVTTGGSSGHVVWFVEGRFREEHLLLVAGGAADVASSFGKCTVNLHFPRSSAAVLPQMPTPSRWRILLPNLQMPSSSAQNSRSTRGCGRVKPAHDVELSNMVTQPSFHLLCFARVLISTGIAVLNRSALSSGWACSTF